MKKKLTATANTRILLYTETVSERSFETQAVPVECMEDSDDCWTLVEEVWTWNTEDLHSDWDRNNQMLKQTATAPQTTQM